MESPENYTTVFRPFHKTLKINETDFHISTATTTTRIVLPLKNYEKLSEQTGPPQSIRIFQDS